MNLKIAEQWAVELESGKWKQTVGALNKNDQRFCCLGVLCEMALKAGVRSKKSKPSLHVMYSGEKVKLPWRIQRWARLKTDTGTIHRNRCVALDLAQLNDARTSFKRIAAIIREHAEEL